VPADFLRRLIGRPQPSAEAREALEELTRLAAERPTLAEPCRLLGDVLPALFGVPLAEPELEIPAERARSKWGSGVPLLRGESLAPDAGFERRFRTVAAAANLSTADCGVRELVPELLAGRREAIDAWAESHRLDPALTATVLRLTLFPQLAAVHARWTDELAALRWEHGFCPVCGSWPLLGEFRGLEQQRVLRCGLCAAGWETPRLRCPYCATTDHEQLGYFFVEAEEGKYRVTTCSSCRGYVKMVSTLSELSPPRLLVADVATLHLDLAAADRGFATP
jgi:FdhE protein